MPKKEHVHIVTDESHKELLADLGEKFGSMTKAFEYAIELLEKSEEVGTCSTCEIKQEAEQSTKIQEMLNIICLSADNIREILKYIQGDFTIPELMNQTREKAYQFGKYYVNYTGGVPENTYKNLLLMIEEWKKRTRLFKTIQVDKFANTIIGRVNVFEKHPIFVLMGLIGYLQALEITFDVDISQENIIITWIDPNRYSTEKNQVEFKILSFIREAAQELKPFLFKQGYLPIGPDLLDWFADATIENDLFPFEISYRFINRFLEKEEFDTTSAEHWAKFIQNIVEFLNYATQFKIKSDNNRKTFKIEMLCVTPNVAKLLLQQSIVILAKYGWKLKNHKIDYKLLTISFYYVGDNDPTILDPLYITNFSAYLNQRFQKLRKIPVDEYEDLTKALYQSDPELFRKVFHQQGSKFANAIKLLGKNDLKSMREIGLRIIPQLVNVTQRDPKGVSFVAEPSKFSIIFKTTDMVEMESMAAIFIAVMEGFGYLNIKPKFVENVLSVEFVRPQKIDVKKVEIISE